jgi:hypothetical protein
MVLLEAWTEPTANRVARILARPDLLAPEVERLEYWLYDYNRHATGQDDG